MRDMRDDTLCFLVNGDQVLLGKKKRGFGVGRYNGYGGKVQAGETVLAAALREIHEESELTVLPEDIKEMGTIVFHFDDHPEASIRAHIFMTTRYSGIPQETDEMKPEWFKTTEIPFSEMWEDDPLWLPQILEGKKVQGVCHFTSFSAQGGKLRSHQFSFS